MLDLTKQTQIMPLDEARSDHRLRVCILSYRSDPKVGGQGVYVDYLSNALAKAGAHVDVVSGPPYPTLSADVNLVKLPSLDLFSKPHHGHYELRPRHLLSPTDTYEYFGHLSGKFVEPFAFGQRAYQYLKRHRGKYDIVLDNQTLAHGIGRIQNRLDLPLTAMIHHPITRDLKLAVDAAPDWKHRWLARRWYSFVNMQIKVARKLPAITCPSEHAKADIVSEFGVAPERIHPISLGVDQKTFCPDPNTVIAPKKIITTASADTPLKGLHILVEAYHKLLGIHPELKLMVIGKLRKGLARNAILKFGLQDRIEFKSDLTREDLAEEFRSATVAVTPSLYEGFGLPAAEAMSCGTPVIVTDGGALPEVAGEAGWVVPKGDPMALADAIDALISDSERRAETAQACLKHARTQFNWDSIAPKYLDFFRTAMAAQC
jgi:glycosyltransferase involved in cell wall biosynthesis